MKALICVDPQNDFFEGGNLAVAGSNRIIQIINKLTKSEYFDMVIFTKDWHPSNHKSFASQYSDKKLFDVIDLNGIQQVLWPDHCVENTQGAEFHPDIDINITNFYIFKKGMNVEVDSYSGFFENDHKTSTGLSKFLLDNKIDDVYIAGIATDYCVKYTAIDSIKEGFFTTVILDAISGISPDLRPVLEEMVNSNIKLRYSTEYLD